MPSTTSAGPDGPSSNGEAASAPLVAGAQMQPVLLSDPLDEGNLTDAVKFCRRQIEFFTADPEDVHARHKKGGIKQDIYVGQVGIRCVHCARLGKTEQPSGSVSYPASISLVYQAVRNWQRYHLKACPTMPDALREEATSFRRQHSGKAIGQYWLESCQRKGLYDSQGMILYSPDGSNATVTTQSLPATSRAQKKKSGTAKAKGKARRRSPTKQSAPETDGTAATNGDANCNELALQDDPFGSAIDDLLGGNGLEGGGGNEAYNVSGLLGSVDDGDVDTVQSAVGGASAPANDSSSLPDFRCKNGTIDPLPFNSGNVPMNQQGLNFDVLAATGLLGSSNTIGEATPKPSMEALPVAPTSGTFPDPAMALSPFSPSLTALLAGEQAQALAQGTLHITAPIPPPPLHDGSANSTPAPSSVLPPSIPSSPTTSLVQKINLACGIVEAVRAMDAFPEANNESTHHDLDALQSLGEELYEHFCGFRPFSTTNQRDADIIDSNGDADNDDSDKDQRSKRGKVVGSGSYIPLSDMGFPSSLSILVQQLCSINNNFDNIPANMPYTSVEDVLEELQLMINDPDRYLFGGSVGQPQTGTLHFEESKLYGREEELSDAMNAFRNLKTNERREVLCITGDSGTGKSALAMQMRKPVEDMGGYFLAEKFDELQQVQQVPAVFAALNHFCAEVCRRGGTVLSNMRERLYKALGTEGKVLVGLIPNLSNIILEYRGDAAATTTTIAAAPELTGQAAFMRLLFCSRQLIKTISCPEHPAVLLLDDMQWADELSLQLLEAVTTDNDTKSFLVIACYRDGEVSIDHPLQRRLGAIHRSGTVISEIHVDNIGKESVVRLVSDALRISPSQARPLANLVHSKTSGQPLFVIQFLKLLNEESLLRFSLSSRQWQWDLDAISGKRVADNVAELMTAKMLRYPVEVLWSLKLAACLGHECDKTMLDLLGPGNDTAEDTDLPSITSNLDVAVADGLIIKSGTSTKAVYRFSHDQIQYAAYSLIAPEEQVALHLQIGWVLFEKASPEDLDSMLFAVLDQFGRGSSLLVDRSEKTQIAQLCLMAAKRSFSNFAHQSSSIFALQGILLLDEDHWRTDYELSLGLYSTSAEAHNICGVFDQVETCANIVFAQGRCFEDKLPVYFSLVQVTGTQGRLLDATKLGLEVLQKLGLSLPAKPNVEAAIAFIDQTRVMLEEIPTVTLIGRMMQDSKALSTMKMLALLSRYTYMARQELMAVLMCRMVQMTIQHGICDHSIMAFSCYGFLACNSGRVAVGHKYGKLALSLLDQFKAKEILPSVFVNVYAQMIPIDPVQAAFPQLEVAFETGKAYGDLDMAFICANRGTATRFFFGDNLSSIEDSARKHVQEMQKVNEENSRVSEALFLQAVLNLTDSSCNDPCTLTGEATDQSEALEKAQQSNNTAVMIQVCRLRVYLLYLFGQDQLAGELVENMLENFSVKRPFPNSVVVPTTFLTGLVAAMMARTKDPTKWMPIANACRGKIRIWSEASQWNYKHMLRFIEAEIAYSKGHHEEAKTAYDDSIRLSGEHRFIHDQALCLERAALYHKDVSGGSSTLSVKYLSEARDLYSKWGAHRKAAHVQVPTLDHLYM